MNHSLSFICVPNSSHEYVTMNCHIASHFIFQPSSLAEFTWNMRLIKFAVTLILSSGYMAPEYAMEGLFSVKSDVFSFGVLLLEIISGKRNSKFYLSDKGQSLLVYVCFQTYMFMVHAHVLLLVPKCLLSHALVYVVIFPLTYFML